VALARHLKQIDGEQHTILLLQVENEPGTMGSVRDWSPEANRLFAGPVPADLLAAMHKQPGTWIQVFGGDADENFQAYYQAEFVNAIAAAGKAEFAIPYYVNVWVNEPPPELPQRQLDSPGKDYPSGGAVQRLVGLWRAMAPAIDMIGPDTAVRVGHHQGQTRQSNLGIAGETC
jgi:beta-galactosidase GanA